MTLLEHPVVELSVIIPFHRNLSMLQRVLQPFRVRPGTVEIIIVADGATEDCSTLATESGARTIVVAERRGPAAARNRGAQAARGSILVFVDGDVVAAPDAIDRFAAVLSAEPAVAAVFGAYDERPPEAGFFSQYKNLSHRYVHATTSRDAVTFWAGLGAVRAHAFRTVGGFDECFDRPCVEDIEFGYRLTSSGHRIVVDAAIQGTHLKRWSFRSSVRSDIVDRGIPWTQLLLRRRGTSQRDLNLTPALRLSVAASYALVLLAALGMVWPVAWLGAGIALAAIVGFNRAYYAYFARVRGPWFAVRVIPAHILHHLCNGFSFVAGFGLFHARRIGVVLPGSLPSKSAISGGSVAGA